MQPDHLVADGGEHPLHLVILALVDGQACFPLVQDFQLRRAGLVVLVAQVDTVGKERDSLFTHGISQPDGVGLRTLVPGRRDAMGPLAVIGDQHQPGGIEIEAPHHVQFAHGRLVEQVEHGGVIRVLVGADISFRLVQHEVAILQVQGQGDTVKLDLVLLIDVKGGLLDQHAVYQHFP